MSDDTQNSIETNPNMSQKLGEACVKHFGLDKSLKKLEEKYIPKYIRRHSAVVIAVGKAGIEQKLVFEWKF